MAKKKQKFVRPHKKLLIVAGVVLALGVLYGGAWLQHNHAITQDKKRFAQAGNDVEIVADQIVATVGQPADRKDGGKCRYASEKFGKGPLSCDVYSYLVYGVSNQEDVNKLVQKTESVAALNGSIWKFERILIKPYEYRDLDNEEGTFMQLQRLFDLETRADAYTSFAGQNFCGLNFLYHNSVSHLSGYPDFNVAAPQTVLIDISCGGKAKSELYPIQD